ncbi:helix-turn-helix transcriptional regulator [Alkalibacillus almallahensis]|uniref:helix-turn-helix transcriptional regulator n=1 Tax=Alkalibacillus almallahensis TaxID=1379154 RepID=UPI001420953D|nr:helix-turn-helix transcriptional regulator [Alkalibacillus almallahensis]NIK13178.1 AraC-like DNA-binding protein [Alkalibacillus almallahensis]
MKDLMSLDTVNQDSQLFQLLALKEAIEEFDPKVIACLEKKDQIASEHELTELCFQLLEIPEEDHLLIFRIYFTSLITEIIRRFTLRGRLQTAHLGNGLAIIAIVENWETVAEFMSLIPWFIDKVIHDIIGCVALIEYTPTMGRILNLINENIEGSHLTLKWISEALEVSTSHLCNIFKTEMDETIGSYVNRRKIQEAAFDIKESQLTLTEIGEKYGFGSQSYFIRTFKRYMNTTPLKYKKQYFLTHSEAL